MSNLESRLFEIFLRKTLPKEIGGILEINTGCFGGLDAILIKQVLMRSYREFFQYLRSTKNLENTIKLNQIEISIKENVIREFFFQIYTNELKGLENLFSRSLANLINLIKQEIKNKNYKNFFLISTNEAHTIEGEENNLFVAEMQCINGVKSQGLTIKEFIEMYNSLEDEKKKQEFLNNSFIYDDFTDKELLEYCAHNDLNYKELKNIFSQINSFYPKEIDFATDRDFAEILEAYGSERKLIKKIISSNNLSVVYDTEKKCILTDKATSEVVDIQNKVLKIKDTNSGKGIYLPGEFDLNKISELLSNIDKFNSSSEFTLEDFINGAKIYIWENGKLVEKIVDVRFGFYYNPDKPDEIKTITTYGRFNDKGKKSNIAQGGGVCEVSIVADDKYKETQKALLNAYRTLANNPEDLNVLETIIKKNAIKTSLQYNGKPFPISPIPFVISESAFREIERTALFLAKKMQEKRESILNGGKNKSSAFIFALDTFINPSPFAYLNN